MFIIKIDENLCKGCELCVIECPSKSITMGKKTNKFGQIIPEQFDIKACIGCLRCYIVCPESAITIIKENEKKS